MNYTNLHCHTDHSLLDGYSTVGEYASRAKELGMTHLAVTDHGTMTNSRNLMKVARENNLVPIIGMEAYYTHDASDRRPKKEREPDNDIYYHLLVIARNENGLQNLQAMNSVAWSQSHFYQKPRIDLELLDKYREDIIVSSACLGGVLCKAFEREDPEYAYKHASLMKEIFGDNYYIEVMSPNGAKINNQLLKLADDLGIKPIVTDDCHHARPEDLVANDAMLIMQTKEKVGKDVDLSDMSKVNKMELLERFNYLYPDRMMTFRDLDVYLKDGKTHQQNFEAQGIYRTDFIENTMEVAGKIGEYPLHEKLDLLPKPKGVDPNKVLASMALAGLQKRGKSTPEYRERLQMELNVITEKNFATYFLITKDFLDWARARGIRAGFGRGSGAGSLLNYALYITHVDPIEHNLLFERFLDEARSDYPDIDNDVPDTRRGEVRQYLVDKFHNVGNIMTFSDLDGKQMFRDVCRVLRVPYVDTEAAVKYIETWDDIKDSKELSAFKKSYPDVEALGDRLRGRVRQRGVHASGIIVSKEPISNYATIETSADKNGAAGERIDVVGLDMHEAESLGFIKIDLLGLKALGIVDDILQMVEKRHGRAIDIYNLNFADEHVFKSIRKGNTAGIFQLEGAAFTEILDSMPIESLDDIVAGTSLIRPGAADSRFGKQYLNFRNHGKIHKVHPDIDPYLSETGGAVLYQEQLMHMCVHLAGMTKAESNEVRRAVGKKNAEKLALWSQRFIEGAAEKISEKKAEALWRDIEASAKYSFNKSHAVAYSMLTYVMAFLKHYYPLEFYTCLLARETKGEKKVDYMIEAKRNNVRIMTPHINVSDAHMSIKSDEKGDYIRMGLSDVKNVGEKASRKIIQKRPFHSFAHLQEVASQKGSGISIRTIGSLDKIGGVLFSDNPLKGNERDNYYEYLNIPSFGLNTLPDYVESRIRPLVEYTTTETFVVMGAVTNVVLKDTWGRVDMTDDTGKASAFINPGVDISKGDQRVFLIQNNSVVSFIDINNPEDANKPLVKWLFTEKMQPFYGLYRVVGFSPRKTKAGKDMASIVLTKDDHTLVGMVVFPGQFHMASTHAKPGAIVRIKSSNTKDGTPFLDYITGV